MKYFNGRRKYFVPLFLVITLVFVTKCYCASYYVDFDNGSNANDGTSVSTSWRSLPGIQNPTGGYKGWRVIQAGDSIYIKAGTTYDSADGGRIIINSTWYGNGTSGSYITIQVSDLWGSGNVTINGRGITLPHAYNGLFQIEMRNYIQILGTSSNKLIIANSSARGFQSYGTSAHHQLGIKLGDMQFSSSSGDVGCNFSYSNDFEVRDCTATSNRGCGFWVGGGNDENCDGGKFYDCIANGNGAAHAPGGSMHGFGLYGCTNIEYWRCTAYSNYRDGFDFGTTSNKNNVNVKLVDCTSYSNGEDGFAGNGGTSGTRTFTYINCISYNNGATGWNIYSGGVTAYIYHCLAANNNKNFVVYDEDPNLDAFAYIKNCIGYKPGGRYNLQIWTYKMGHANGTKFYTDYNLWIQNSSEGFAGINVYPAGSDSHFYNGTSKPTTWSGKGYLPDGNQADGNSGWSQNAAFVDWANHDYHPTSSSWTIGKGTYISSPVEAQTDRDGKVRSNPPTIGPYEYVGQQPAPPKGLAIIP